MLQETLLTAEGLKELEQELETLKTVGRKEAAEKIKVARSFGDLSENAEYDEAMSDQAKLEARINEIETMIKNAKVFDEDALGTEVARELRVLGVVGVGAHAERAELVGPLEDGVQIARHLGQHELHRAEHDRAGGAVDGDHVPFADDDAGARHDGLLALRVDLERLDAADARRAHAAGDDAAAQVIWFICIIVGDHGNGLTDFIYVSGCQHMCGCRSRAAPAM